MKIQLLMGGAGAGVLASARQLDEVRFLGGLKLGLLATQPALGPGDLHAYAVAGFGEGAGKPVEFSDHEVAVPAGGQCLAQPGPGRLVPVRPWST